MSRKSNDQGRGYEYIFLVTLCDRINEFRMAKLEENSCFKSAKKSWNNISNEQKKIYKISALAGIETLFELEPLITENTDDVMSLYIQKDEKGEIGDVRDIVIIRDKIKWEIGISLKHNHFAVKHSRLSHTLDFGKRWLGYNCSNQYWENIKPVFDFMKTEQLKKTQFCDLDDKAGSIYIPLLNAFMKEIQNLNSLYNDVPQKLVEYLLGKFDFYKVISVDRKRITNVQGYNFHNTLNKPSKHKKATILVPISKLPTKIFYIGIKEGSNDTIELSMNNGWQFAFRIHNAEKIVAPTLKFDVQIIGMPTTIISIDSAWRE